MVISVASDPGSARTLIPVLRELQNRSVPIQVFASGPSVRIFQTELTGVKIVSRLDDISVESASKLLRRSKASVLMTGAGAYNQIEHSFRLAARTNDLKSISVLDYWFEYEARFQRVNNGAVVESRPDLVCAMDEISREGLIRWGVKPEQIVVTGSPNLEETVRWWLEKGSRDCRALRKKYGLVESDLNLVFFSEPYYTAPDGRPLTGPGGLFGEDGTPIFGYTAPRILSSLIDVLLRELEFTPRSVHLLIKPHPMEWPGALHYEHTDGSLIRADLIVENRPYELMAIADVVIGMSSIALLEAALIGKIALSVQIGLRETGNCDPCIGNVLGYTIPVLDRAALINVVRRVCQDSTLDLRVRPLHELNVFGAAARVADIVVGNDERD
jgi:hypothetical protein